MNCILSGKTANGMFVRQSHALIRHDAAGTIPYPYFQTKIETLNCTVRETPRRMSEFPTSPGRQFSWGGSVAIIFTEDGLYEFGHSRASRDQWRSILATLPMVAALILLTIFEIVFGLKISLVTLEIVWGVILAAGMVPLYYFRLRQIRRRRNAYPKDIRFEDLMKANEKYDFFDWSQISLARFGKIMGKRILEIWVGSSRMRARRLIVGIPEEDRAIQIQQFLSEKIGDKLKGTPK